MSPLAKPLLLVFALLCSLLWRPAVAADDLPNIVLIYFDDLGYGDVGCNGASAIQTPHIDRIAREGLRFTDAHSASATCTPSRYAMLTGEYAWRKKGTGVLPGDATLIIEPGRTTLPSILRQAGYHTAVVGKWHLGLGTPGSSLDWNGEIKPGPLEVGFDDSFIIPATGDRVPCVYVENHRVADLDPADPISVAFGKKIGSEPTGREQPELLKLHPSHGHDNTIVNGISRIGFMTGGKAARWVDEDMADVLTSRAVNYINTHKSQRFFLFFSLHDIHVPRVPHSRFAGKSGLGPRGDVILQGDWCVGEILRALDELQLAENTLVLFSSDNGPVVDDGYRDDAVEKLSEHKPAGPFRGGKYSAYEGGTRVPFLARWPARIKPGVTSALVCQIDLCASFAALTGYKLVNTDAPDSYNVLPALLGESLTGREHLVEHARVLSMRVGDWKYIEPSNGPERNQSTNTELGHDPRGMLFNLKSDSGERENLIASETDRALQLRDQLNGIRAAQRSRR